MNLYDQKDSDPPSRSLLAAVALARLILLNNGRPGG